MDRCDWLTRSHQDQSDEINGGISAWDIEANSALQEQDDELFFMCGSKILQITLKLEKPAKI